MTTKLPQDAFGNEIQALGLKDDGAQTIAVTTATAKNANAFNGKTRVVYLYATKDMFIRFGGDSVTAAATDHFIPAGLYLPFSLGGDGTPHKKYIAAIRSAEDGTLYISETN